MSIIRLSYHTYTHNCYSHYLLMNIFKHMFSELLTSRTVSKWLPFECHKLCFTVYRSSFKIYSSISSFGLLGPLVSNPHWWETVTGNCIPWMVIAIRRQYASSSVRYLIDKYICFLSCSFKTLLIPNLQFFAVKQYKIVFYSIQERFLKIVLYK